MKITSSSSHGLSTFDLLMFGVGAIVGAGIFVIVGHVAAVNAGPAVVLSFLIAGAACALAGLCYAEMGAAVPSSGSAYAYAYVTMGRFIGWLVGWDLILEYSLAASTVAVGWSSYALSFLRDFGITFPPALCHASGTRLVMLPAEIATQLHLQSGWTPINDLLETALVQGGLSLAQLPQVTALFNLPASFLILAIAALLTLGIRESARVNNLIVLFKIGVILLFAVLGIACFSRANWGGAFLPENTGTFGSFGWSGVLRGAGGVFFAFLGFDAIATTTLEARNPKRAVPIGILGSIALCTTLYILVAIALTGVVNYKLLDVPDPIALGIDAIQLPWLAPVVKLGAVAGLTSVTLAALLALPRVLYAIAEDGLLPKAFTRVHARFGTPVFGTWLSAITIAVISASLPIDVLGEMVSIGTLFAFILVCIGVLLLRRQRPNSPRPFEVPAVWIVAPLGALTSFILMLGLPWATWVRWLVWMVAGIAFYFVYESRRRKGSA